IFQINRENGARMNIFKDWKVIDIITPDKIEHLNINGHVVKVNALHHFRDYAEELFTGSPFAPCIEGGNFGVNFNLYFFPAFCVVEANPNTMETSFMVFSPSDKDNPTDILKIIHQIELVRDSHDDELLLNNAAL